MKNHTFTINKKGWYVLNLVEYSKDKNNTINFKLDLRSICLNDNVWGELSMYSIINHFRQSLDADLKHPIIIGEDGLILDGWHRIVKAIIQNKRYIKAVKFKQNPEYDFN
jgi:hypothetical protein